MTPDINQAPAGPPSEALVDRYFAGECDVSAAAAVEAWGGGTPDGTPNAKLVRDILVADTVPVQSAQKLQQGIHARLVRRPTHPASSNTTQPLSHRGKAGRRWVPFVGTAAILAAAAVTGSFMLRSTADINEVAISTSYGERSRFQLPDGSTVLLGPGSTLQYARDFQSRRSIRLDGEALFTVTQSEGTPFIVQAGAATARVLGTSFTVRRYATDAATRIIVAEGKVAVLRNDANALPEPAVLITGEQALVPDSSGMSHERVADIGAALGWTQGKLAYQRAPLRRVLTDMQRMYDVTLSLGSPQLGDQLFTGVIDQSAAADAIAMLAATFNFTVRHEGRTFTLGE